MRPPERDPRHEWWEQAATYIAWTVCAIVLILVAQWVALSIFEHIVKLLR